MPDAPAPAAAPAATAESTDDIVASLLADPTNKSVAPAEPSEVAVDDEPEEPAAQDDAYDPDALGEDDAEPVEIDDAAPVAGKLPKALADARAALEEGDIDKAFELAFGKKPEEVQPNNKTWTQWRASQRKAEQRQQAETQRIQQEGQRIGQWEQQARGQLSQAIEQLKPYEAHFQAAQAFQRDGDPAHLVKLIELTTGLSYDDAQKAILQKQRRTPGERLLAQQLAEIRAKLEETNAQKTQQQQQLSAQQVYANDLAIIRGKVAKVEGGEITKVPQYAERIYNVLMKTRTPAGLAMTEAEAARRVLAAERRKLETHPLLKKKAAVSEAAATLARARTGKRPAAAAGAPLRRDSQNNGGKDPKALESTDDIIADLIAKNGKVKSA